MSLRCWRFLAGAFVSIAASLQVGCSARVAPDTAELVAAADVINSVFCGLAIAKQNAQRLGMELPLYVKFTLELKVISADSVGIDIGSKSSGGGSGGSSGSGKSGSTAKTSVVASQGSLALPFVPSLSLADNQGWTVDTTLDLLFKLDNIKPAFCSAAQINPYLGKAGAASNALSIWIGNTVTTAAATNGGFIDPKSAEVTRTFVYDATFSVTKSASGSVGFPLTIVPVTITPSASSSRNDVQHLSMVLSSDQATAKSSRLVPTTTTGRNKESLLVAVPAVRDFSAIHRASELSPVPYF
jgi:hypothetical protein